MSREVAEMQEIRREKENIQQLMKIYEKRNEELNAKEEVLIKKMQAERAKEFDWRKLMGEVQDPEGYVICESILGLSRLSETPEMKEHKIMQLREEVLQKQYENMKLEKELESRKEEHRVFHDMLLKKKKASGGCSQSDCQTLLEGRKHPERKYGSEDRMNQFLDNKFGGEVSDDVHSGLD